MLLTIASFVSGANLHANVGESEQRTTFRSTRLFGGLRPRCVTMPLTFKRESRHRKWKWIATRVSKLLQFGTLLLGLLFAEDLAQELFDPLGSFEDLQAFPQILIHSNRILQLC